MTYQEALALKTDEERLRHLHEISYVDWSLVADWSEEADNPKNKKIFHDTAVNLYRIEEYKAMGDI